MKCYFHKRLKIAKKIPQIWLEDLGYFLNIGLTLLAQPVDRPYQLIIFADAADGEYYEDQ